MLKGQLQHALGQGGREQIIAALSGFRHAPEEIADVCNKPEIEHAIRFIQHHYFNVLERVDVLLVVIDQPPWSANQNIDAILNCLTL